MKLLAQKSKTSNKNVKSRVLCKSGSNYNKTKMEVPTNKIISAPSLPPDPVGKKGGNNYECQSKLKFINMIPGNPSKDTSDGVQELIKHFTQCIEKKTPLKGATRYSYSDGGNIESPKYNSIQFKGVARKLNERKKVEGSKLEKNISHVKDGNKKTLMKKTNHPVKFNSVSTVKKDSIGAKGKVSKLNSSTKKAEEVVDKKHKKDLPENKNTQSQPVKKVTTDSGLPPENEGCLLKKTPLSRGGGSDGPVQNKIKRRRPSEIPLRKDRTDSYKKPKFVSLLLQKPMKQVESATSVGLGLTSKSSLPTEEVCPELQMTISVNFSSEKINIEGEKNYICGVEDEEMQESIRLDRCFKSPNIPDVVNSSTNNSLEEKPSTARKANVVDLNKVKTSSFTLLRTSSTVLDRLESLHKQNVLSKEKSASKSKILMSKASLNFVKENSNKSSVPLLSSKGNKSGLKVKSKKSRKETNQEPGGARKLKKRTKSSGETPHPKETATTTKVGRSTKVERSPRESRFENVTNENLKVNVENRKKEESRTRKIKSSSGKSALRATPRDEEFKSSDPVISGVEYFESQNLEKPKPGTNTSYNKNSSRQSLSINNSSEKTEVHDLEENTESQEIPTTPPPTPENGVTNDEFTQMEQVINEEWSSKTLIFEQKFTSEDLGWCNVVQETETADAETIAEQAKESEEMIKHSPLFVKGILLNFCKGEPPEKPEEPESPPVKKQLRIDLNTHEVSIDDEKVEDNEENKLTVELPPTNTECGEVSPQDKDRSDSSEKGESVEGRRKSKNISGDVLSSAVADETGSFSHMILKPRRSCSSLKRKQHCKSGGSLKGIRKKKIRSDAGDRPSPSASTLFNSDASLQNKTKPDAKMRSGLTKSSKWEEKSDVFEDAPAIKLKRRNSEPNSFRGYVWKCADAATPRGNKTSVSSMTSSLRHLNTDEIDDFIFWEAVPQKMTSCWEMSLYHFKRPWSVLSCSVFRDNRMSSTPGLILENLRNGGILNTRRSIMNQSERVAYRKENPFDVEPSIAQKNIDIRNWLAALNFPTLPSTSTDGLSEGNFATQFSVDSQNQKVSQKRRKLLPNLKFSDEASKKKAEEKEKYKRSTKWDSCEEEDLTELIRRKSGGFVTKEQYLNSEHSVHRPNVTVNFCVYSKSAEESILVETNDRSSICEPRKYKSVEVATQPEVSISATIINSGAAVGDQLVEKIKMKEKPRKIQKEVQVKSSFEQFLEGDFNHLRSNVNIWKYLFLLTLFLIVIHYCSLNNFLGHY